MKEYETCKILAIIVWAGEKVY